MPELPEVENTKQSLLIVENKKIIGVYKSHYKLRLDIPEDIYKIINSYIVKIQRKAKYLLFHLSCGDTVIAHLGMSGKFTYSREKEKKKHDHVILYFNNGYQLAYNDTRRFGFFVLEKTICYYQKFFSNIALDAIDDSFTAEYLLKKLSGLQANIKNSLLNQGIVAGIGNIYASEVLFLAKINPLRLSKSLTLEDCKRLVESIKYILYKSIKLGGSTLRDYQMANGDLGHFQNHFLVYSREGQPCLHQGCDGVVSKIIQNGRSTFYCKKSQE